MERGETALTPASMEVHLQNSVSAALLARWKEEMERGERQAFLRYGPDGKPSIQMRYEPKDPSPFPQLDD